tara:strand:+ start:127 stop:417 length:291 start_codon:yes stop_codon:yes gene_type:complete
MTLSNEIQTFLDSQIEYYTREAKSYKEMTEGYNLDGNSVSDTTFGIIVGCIYSSFLQTYTNQNNVPDSEEMEEFSEIIIKNAKRIKESIITDDIKN